MTWQVFLGTVCFAIFVAGVLAAAIEWSIRIKPIDLTSARKFTYAQPGPSFTHVNHVIDKLNVVEGCARALLRLKDVGASAGAYRLSDAEAHEALRQALLDVDKARDALHEDIQQRREGTTSRGPG